MSMLETVVASQVNPHLSKDDRMKPRQPQEFLPSGFVNKPKQKRKTLRQQLALVAKVFGGRDIGDDDK